MFYEYSNRKEITKYPGSKTWHEKYWLTTNYGTIRDEK